MKTRVDILAVERKESIYEGGKKSVKFICQCVCHLDKIQVGELVVPESLAPEGVMPGSYIVEYGLNVNWQTKKLEGQLKSLSGAPGSPRVVGDDLAKGGNVKPAEKVSA